MHTCIHHSVIHHEHTTSKHGSRPYLISTGKELKQKQSRETETERDTDTQKEKTDKHRKNWQEHSRMKRKRQVTGESRRRNLSFFATSQLGRRTGWPTETDRHREREKVRKNTRRRTEKDSAHTMDDVHTSIIPAVVPPKSACSAFSLSSSTAIATTSPSFSSSPAPHPAPPVAPPPRKDVVGDDDEDEEKEADEAVLDLVPVVSLAAVAGLLPVVSGMTALVMGNRSLQAYSHTYLSL